MSARRSSSRLSTRAASPSATAGCGLCWCASRCASCASSSDATCSPQRRSRGSQGRPRQRGAGACRGSGAAPGRAAPPRLDPSPAAGPSPHRRIASAGTPSGGDRAAGPALVPHGRRTLAGLEDESARPLLISPDERGRMEYADVVLLKQIWLRRDGQVVPRPPSPLRRRVGRQAAAQAPAPHRRGLAVRRGGGTLALLVLTPSPSTASARCPTADCSWRWIWPMATCPANEPHLPLRFAGWPRQRTACSTPTRRRRPLRREAVQLAPEKQGSVRVADFGLARLRGAGRPASSLLSRRRSRRGRSRCAPTRSAWGDPPRPAAPCRDRCCAFLSPRPEDRPGSATAGSAHLAKRVALSRSPISVEGCPQEPTHAGRPYSFAADARYGVAEDAKATRSPRPRRPSRRSSRPSRPRTSATWSPTSPTPLRRRPRQARLRRQVRRAGGRHRSPPRRPRGEAALPARSRTASGPSARTRPRSPGGLAQGPLRFAHRRNDCCGSRYRSRRRRHRPRRR